MVAILIVLIIIVLCFQTGFYQSQGIFVTSYVNLNINNALFVYILGANVVCLTPSCVKIANSILEKVDLDVDPCEDFYSFACGNFINNTVIPEDRSFVSSFTIVKLLNL